MTKTEAHRLDAFIAGALLCRTAAPNSHSQHDTHDNDLQREAERRGYPTERKGAEIMGRRYSVTKIDLGDYCNLTLFSTSDEDRDDLAPPIMAEAVPEQILDDEHDDCDDPDCQKCQHVEALAAERRAEQDAEAARRGAERMRDAVGLTDADLDDEPSHDEQVADMISADNHAARQRWATSWHNRGAERDADDPAPDSIGGE